MILTILLVLLIVGALGSGFWANSAYPGYGYGYGGGGLGLILLIVLIIVLMRGAGHF